jgi:hypothetical protein
MSQGFETGTDCRDRTAIKAAPVNFGSIESREKIPAFLWPVVTPEKM